MFLGAELALFIYGIVAMVRRKFSMGKSDYVLGWRAVVLGAMCASILPVLLVVGITVGAVFVFQGIELSTYRLVWIDIFGLIFGSVATIKLGRVFLAQQEDEAATRDSDPRESDLGESVQVPSFDASNPYAPTQMTPKHNRA